MPSAPAVASGESDGKTKQRRRRQRADESEELRAAGDRADLRRAAQRRATSARTAPFQPTAEAPNNALTSMTAGSGQSALKPATPTPDNAIITPNRPSIRRGDTQRSATAPQAMRPTTPAACAEE